MKQYQEILSGYWSTAKQVAACCKIRFLGTKESFCHYPKTAWLKDSKNSNCEPHCILCGGKLWVMLMPRVVVHSHGISPRTCFFLVYCIKLLLVPAHSPNNSNNDSITKSVTYRLSRFPLTFSGAECLDLTTWLEPNCDFFIKKI